MVKRIVATVKYFLECIGKFGLIPGFRVYCTVSFAVPDQVISIKIPDCRTSFRLRAKSADVWMFEEVWMKGDYNFPYPIAPETIVDAGAHVGMTSLFLANRFPQARIIAIEPVSENVDMLRENTKTYDNIDIVQAALWCNSNLLAIENPEDHSSAFRMSDSFSGKIQGITVWDAMELLQTTNVDLLKIDIEGAEKEVFTGDSSWMARVNMIVIELHDRFRPGCYEALHDALSSHDFIETPLGENVVLVRSTLTKN